MFASTYSQCKYNMGPPKSNIDKVGTKTMFDLSKISATAEFLKNNPTADVKNKADAGDPDAAFDYAMRYFFSSNISIW